MPIRNPWERRKWRKGVLRSDAERYRGVPCFVVAAAMAAVGWGLALAMPELYSLSFTNWSWGWLFAFLAAAFVVLGGFMAVRNVPSRSSHLVMQAMPGVIGGKFSAQLELPQKLPQGTTVTLRLVNQMISRSREANIKSCDTVHEEIKQYNANDFQFRAGKHCISLQYDIPDHTKDPRLMEHWRTAGWSGVKTKTYDWFMEVKAAIPRGNLDLKFQLPIYRTDGSVSGIYYDRRNYESEGLHLNDDGTFTEAPLPTHLESSGEAGKRTNC